MKFVMVRCPICDYDASMEPRLIKAFMAWRRHDRGGTTMEVEGKAKEIEDVVMEKNYDRGTTMEIEGKAKELLDSTGEQANYFGERLSIRKMPGHWLLARLGKRVLRPGGLELTRLMLAELDIQSTDAVVEFAPGLGVTAQLTLSYNPAFYIAIEGDEAAANRVRRYLSGSNRRCAVGRAEDTGLPESSATVLYCEAMLTMQTPDTKMQILREASRLLKPGGRCGIHELCLVPDALHDATKDEIKKALSAAIQVGAQPLTSSEWRVLMESAGFSVQAESMAPQHLLEPKRFLQDEGLRGSLAFAWNLLHSREAQRRVWNMRNVFRKYQKHLAAIMLVSVKEELRGEFRAVEQ